ncbi:MAG: hypothetical protein KAG26_05145 [Methylococcales bacterium]|nr:hypothetical protein [Methylococcales bacterium]
MASYLYKIIVLFIVSFGFLVSLTVNAGDCRGLYVKDSKSSGMIVKKNNCSDSPHLSASSIIELAPQGRLWLTSITKNESRAKFQLICQNRSNQLLQLAFSERISPWLNLSTLKGCSGWVDNKLSCNEKDQLILYCVLPPIQPKIAAHSATIERTTSVRMRSFNNSNAQTKFDQNKVLDRINLELQLCKQVNQITQTLVIEWIVDSEDKISVKWGHTTIDKALSSCVQAVVTTYPYPKFSKTRIFNTTF